MPFRRQISAENSSASFQRKLQTIGRDVHATVIDPLPRFLKERRQIDELFIPYDPIHPGAYGYRVIAETIADELIGHSTINASRDAEPDLPLRGGFFQSVVLDNSIEATCNGCSELCR